MADWDSGGGGDGGGGDRSGRNRGINPEKLQNVDLEKKIPIFYLSPKGTNEFLYSRFPLPGIELFCNKFRDTIKQDKAVYLPDDNLDTWRVIFDWIQRCLDNQAIEDFEISDEYTPGVFTRYAEIVKAAEYLEVPDRDVAEKVMKRMKTMARAQRGEGQDRRVSWDELEDFYENRSEELAKIASLTVFHSWWNWHLSEQDTPEDMCELGALREDYPDLDEHLHGHVKDYDEFKKQMKAKRNAEQNGSGDSGYGSTPAGWENENAVSGPVGDWNRVEPEAAGDWNSGAADTGFGGNQNFQDTAPGPDTVVDENNKENVAPGGDNASWDQGGGGNDWADEVNDSAPPVASSGW